MASDRRALLPHEVLLLKCCCNKKPMIISSFSDQLASVITTYLSMVKENANLHRCLRTTQDKLRDLQAELHHTKGNVKFSNQSLELLLNKSVRLAQ